MLRWVCIVVGCAALAASYFGLFVFWLVHVTAPSPKDPSPSTPVVLTGKGPFQKTFQTHFTDRDLEQFDSTVNKWISESQDKRILRKHLAAAGNSYRQAILVIDYEPINEK